MKMKDLTASNGALTPDGERLIAWIEAQFAEADKTNDLGKLNSLAGYLSYYYVNVHKLKALTPAQWLQEHLHSGAAAAWRDMLYFEEAARAQTEKDAAAAAAQEQVTGIAGQLEALQKALAEAQAKIAALEEAATPAVDAEPEPEKPARKTRKVKAQEADADGEAQASEDETQDTEAAEDAEAVTDEAEASEQEA